MRARYPDREGYAESDGVPIFWEEYGEGERTVLFASTWQIVHSRAWKMQLPYFARHFRVVTYDPPGNGRSGRPATGYDFDRCAADALAVLDATGTASASLVCLSRGTWTGVILAAEHPERVERLVLVGTPIGGSPRGGDEFHRVRESYEGWAKYNAHYWRAHFRDFLEFWYAQLFSEPHSTKLIEGGIGWTLETTPDVLVAR
jgi:pimeloyl-ACP methyl ester carboxylesterase